MNRRSLLLMTAVLVVVSIPFSVFAASAGNTRVQSGSASVTVDGAACGHVSHWEGGELWARVVMDNSTGGTLGKKHLSSNAVSPLVLEFDFPPALPLITLINNFCAGRATRNNIVVQPGAGESATGVEALNAVLSEIRFPAFDSSGSGPAKITLVFAPASVRPGSAAPSGAGPAGVAVNTFSVAVGNLSGNGMQKIEAITLRSAGAPPSVGEDRFGSSVVSGPVSADNLILTIRDNQAAGWKAWFQSFVVQGDSGDVQEKDGAITFRNSNGSVNPVSLLFSHLGIVRFTRAPESSGSSQVELYFEGLTLAAPPPPAATGSTSTAPTTAAPAPAAAPPAEPAATTTTAPAAATTEAPTSKATDLEPATPGKGRTIAGNTPAAARADTPVSSAVDGADAGSRDPADFPRLGGTVRTVYTANTGKVVSDESATYTTKSDFDQVVAFYDKQPKSAGWEETNRSETSRSASGRTMIIDWRKPQKSAQVRLNTIKGGGTEIWLTVTTQRAAK